MLILTALLALSPKAPACSPALGQILSHSPADGATEVPTDAVIQLHTGDGYLDLRAEAEIRLSVGDDTLGFDLDGWTWAQDLTEQQGLFTLTPAEELPADTTIEVTVKGVEGGSFSFSFTTGGGPADFATPATPSMELDHIRVYEDMVEHSSCDTSAWRELSWTLHPGEADPTELSWLVVYRSPAAEDTDTVATPMAVTGPIGDADTVALDGVINQWDIGVVDPADECFTMVQVNGAGTPSAFSPTVCADELLYDGGEGPDPSEGDDTGDDYSEGGCEGCSAASGIGATLWPGLLALLALRRRR